MFLDPERSACILDRTFRRYPHVREHALQAVSISTGVSWEGTEANILDTLSGSDRKPDDTILEKTRIGLMSAAIEFADLDCRAPRHENWMSGSLESRLTSAFVRAELDHEIPDVFAADLLGAAEKSIGADFALFVEVEGMFVAFVLQAKRTLHDSRKGAADVVDITRDGHMLPGTTIPDPLWQLRRLEQLGGRFRKGLVPAYLFYDNVNIANHEPNLPLLVGAQHDFSQARHDGHIHLSEACSDLASFVVLSIQDHAAKASDTTLLADVVTAVIEAEAQRILLISSGQQFCNRLQEVFKSRHRSRKVRFSNVSLQLPLRLGPAAGSTQAPKMKR